MILAIWQKKGVSGFYSGISAKILHSVLNAALSFYINEKINGAVLKTLGG